MDTLNKKITGWPPNLSVNQLNEHGNPIKESGTIRNLRTYLRVHPAVGLTIHATAKAIEKLDLIGEEPGTGYLRLHDGIGVLQAVFGKNAFAVSLHPGCFQLTEHGFFVFQEASKNDPATAREVPQRDPISTIIYAIHRKQEALKKRDREYAKKEFKKLLLDAMSINTIVWGDGRGLTVMTARTPPIAKMFEFIRQMGFADQTMHVKKLGIGICQVVSGNNVAQLLSQTLREGRHDKKASKLKTTDTFVVGAYAIAFPPEKEMIYIFNKQSFLDECTSV